MDLDPIVFDDITPIEVPVKVGQLEFVLREATGESAVKYTNAKLKRLSLGADGKPSSFAGMGDLEPYLVSLCLFTAKRERPELNNQPVHEADIRAWPHKIQKKLFDIAKQISEIDQDQSKDDLEKIIADAQKRIAELDAKDSKAKNEQSDGTDGSA